MVPVLRMVVDINGPDPSMVGMFLIADVSKAGLRIDPDWPADAPRSFEPTDIEQVHAMFPITTGEHIGGNAIAANVRGIDFSFVLTDDGMLDPRGHIYPVAAVIRAAELAGLALAEWTQDDDDDDDDDEEEG